MSSVEINTKIEKIFANVDKKLEEVISQYRTLLMKVKPDDPMYERLFACCDELEALRKKIHHKNETLSDRIDYVGEVSKIISDLVQDISDYKKQVEAKNISNEMMSILSAIEKTIHMIKPDSTEIEDQILKNGQEKNKHYFSMQQAELEKIIAEHPELH